MATIDDVFKLHNAQEFADTLFGTAANWGNEWRAAFRKVGEAIMADEQVDAQTAAATLPGTTELGPRATEAYEEFLALLKERGHLRKAS